MTILTLMLIPYLPAIPWSMAAGDAPELHLINPPFANLLHFKPAPSQDADTGDRRVGSSQDEGGEPHRPSEPPSAPPGGQAPSDESGSAPKGAAVDGSSRGPSLPLTEAEVKKRSEKYEVKSLGSEGWRMVRSERFVLRGDAPVQDLKRIAAWAERFLDVLQASLDGDLTDLRFSIRVFAEKQAFECYASSVGAKGARSFYTTEQADVVLYCDPTRNRRELAGDLMHELVHEYLDRVLNRQGPAWLAEGLADYFSNYTLEKDGRIVPNASGKVDELKKAIEAKKFVALRRLIGLDFSAFQTGDTGPLYAESASLIRFMAHRDPRAIWELVRGKTLNQFPDFKTLEKEWVKWIQVDEK